MLVLDAKALGFAEELGAISRGDVCLGASVAPYSTQVINVAQIAAENGLDVIANIRAHNQRGCCSYARRNERCLDETSASDRAFEY